MSKLNQIESNGTTYDVEDSGAVRFDAAQNLTTAQKKTARSNIGAVADNQGAANAGKALVVSQNGSIIVDDVGIPDSVKAALLQCFSKTAWIDGNGQTYYTDLYNALYNNIPPTPIDPLDEIAFGNMTYRDIFITGNLINIGNFEGDINLSSTPVTLPDGRFYKINAGTPTIVDSMPNTGSKSLKTFGTSSTQVLYSIPTASTMSGKKILAACSAYIPRYGGTGRAGITVDFISGNPLASLLVIKQAQNQAYEAMAGVLTLPNSTLDSNATLYMGTMRDGQSGSAHYGTGNADAYIDDVVLSFVPNDMTDADALRLYNTYINIISS